jgi:hypothetical protein
MLLKSMLNKIFFQNYWSDLVASQSNLLQREAFRSVKAKHSDVIGLLIAHIYALQSRREPHVS